MTLNTVATLFRDKLPFCPGANHWITLDRRLHMDTLFGTEETVQMRGHTMLPPTVLAS